MPITIDFPWQRDKDGYDLREPKELAWSSILAQTIESRLGLTDGSLPRHRLVRRGGELVPSRPLEKNEDLFKIFIGAARTKEGLLDFVTRYGPLTKWGHEPDGEDVRVGMGWAWFMDQLLRFSPADQTALLLHRHDEAVRCAISTIWLGVDPKTERPQLRFALDSLEEALLLQFGQAIAVGHNMESCGFCGIWFDVGPGTGRRADAKFCSDEHRILFNSKNRKG